MQASWRGPGSPFTVWHEEAEGPGRGLPDALKSIVGEWILPEHPDRPHVFANFVSSLDGRVSFAVPGASDGAAVSRGNAHDRWLMGLLRARADAVVVGDNTLRNEPKHIWTAQAIFPGDAAGFAELRSLERRTPVPLLVFVSKEGRIPAEAAVFRQPTQPVLIATTTRGLDQAREALGHLAHVSFEALGDDAVDPIRLTRLLHREHDVRALLCEGGPTLFGSMLQARAIDELFLTKSPILIGSPAGGTARPALVEGVSFDPSSPPLARLAGVRRAGDYLFLRLRWG
jgi:riboflavin biosynthesis pyrimidine reductase